MKTTRTDCHRPGAIVPADYVHLTFYALADAYMPALNLEFVDRIHDDARADGFELFGGTGKCGVCGAMFKYGELWRHEPTGAVLHVGHDCARKYSMLADHDDWNAQLESRKARRAAAIQGRLNSEKRAHILETNPGLAEALETDHDIVQDIRGKFARYHEISEKQIALVLKIAKDVAARAALPPEVMAPAPIGDGRITVRGVVISKKDHDGAFGPCIKITVKVATDAGNWLAWGTAPESLLLSADGNTRLETGDTVEFATRLEAGREPHFAFFKRATKARIVARGPKGAAADAERAAHLRACEAAVTVDVFACFDAAE